MQHFEGGNNDNALKVFETLGDYKDSKEILRNVRYNIALEKAAQNSYSEAISLLEQVGSAPPFEDVEELIMDYTVELNYIIAVDKYNASSGFSHDLYEMFKELGDYKNSKVYLAELQKVVDDLYGTWVSWPRGNRLLFIADGQAYFTFGSWLNTTANYMWDIEIEQLPPSFYEIKQRIGSSLDCSIIVYSNNQISLTQNNDDYDFMDGTYKRVSTTVRRPVD